MRSFFERIDRKYFPIFNSQIKNKYLDYFMPKYTYLGSLVSVILFTFILMFLLGDRTSYLGFEIALGLVISQAITYGLKALIKRERPYKVLDNLHTFGFDMKDHSFPSGHSSSTFTIATSIFIANKKLGCLAFFMAALVAISRMYVGVHYPSDVLTGILIGIFSSLIVHIFLLQYVDKIINLIF